MWSVRPTLLKLQLMYLMFRLFHQNQKTVPSRTLRMQSMGTVINFSSQVNMVLQSAIVFLLKAFVIYLVCNKVFYLPKVPSIRSFICSCFCWNDSFLISFDAFTSWRPFHMDPKCLRDCLKDRCEVAKVQINALLRLDFIYPRSSTLYRFRHIYVPDGLFPVRLALVPLLKLLSFQVFRH